MPVAAAAVLAEMEVEAAAVLAALEVKAQDEAAAEVDADAECAWQEHIVPAGLRARRLYTPAFAAELRLVTCGGPAGPGAGSPRGAALCNAAGRLLAASTVTEAASLEV
jgi:hypothetical protein